MPGEVKAPRADAQRNREALLLAASRAFAADGVNASLEQIARDAGVGVGTLYRHFPKRDELIAAVYEREVAGVADAAGELLDGRSGMDALRAWTERFLDYAVAKRGLGDALRAIMDCKPDQPSTTLPRIQGALDELLQQGIGDGSIRADVQTDDVLRAMVAIFHIPHAEGWVDQSRRILNLLLDGLEPRR